MSILSELFGGGKKTNPANAAMPYLNQIPGVGHEAYDPYINAGKEAGNTVSGEYQNLIKDPTALISKLMEKYEPSKGYQFKKDQLLKQFAATANAGGIAGTPGDQEVQAEATNGLLSQDMEAYLAHALGLYGTGLEGEQGIANKGFASSGALADILGGSLNQRGGLAFQGQAQQNANKSGMLQALIKALGIGGGIALGGASPFGSLTSLASGGLSSSMYGGG